MGGREGWDPAVMLSPPIGWNKLPLLESTPQFSSTSIITIYCIVYCEREYLPFI